MMVPTILALALLVVAGCGSETSTGPSGLAGNTGPFQPSNAAPCTFTVLIDGINAPPVVSLDGDGGGTITTGGFNFTFSPTCNITSEVPDNVVVTPLRVRR